MKHLVICFLLILSGCDDGSEMTEKVNLALIGDVPATTWETLSEKTIYFAHQSVGENIIDGMNVVLESDRTIPVTVKEYKDSGVPISASLWHSTIGENGDPVGKFKDFQDKLSSDMGNQIDIAAVKLCYVDVERDADVKLIFNEYKKIIDGLKKELPETVIMHMTVPLMSHSDSFIDALKRFIREDNDDLDNIKRNELNQIIRKEYKGKGSFFDLAEYESTYQDGSRGFFVKDGKKYYFLLNEYTDDGGHLNEFARVYIAQQMLMSLSEIAAQKE